MGPLHVELDHPLRSFRLELTLDVAEGPFALVGPSGVGKTTILRAIAGLLRPRRGRVSVGGDVWLDTERRVDLPPERRSVGLVFQEYALFPHLSVVDNVAYGGRARAPELLASFGLVPVANVRPSELSGGERQRVALARALVREPQVFLLDEPLSNLDAKLRASARDELKLFQQRVGTTTVYVTHDQTEAMGLGDRIAVMEHGTIRQLGRPRDVYDDPADTFVATFIGSPPMNLVPRDGVLVGFRPEHLLPAEVIAGERVTIPFLVDRIEYLSGDRHIYGLVSGIGEETRVIARLPSTVSTPLSSGETRDFAVPNEQLRFFDADTGSRTDPVPVGS